MCASVADDIRGTISRTSVTGIEGDWNYGLEMLWNRFDVSDQQVREFMEDVGR